MEEILHGAAFEGDTEILTNLLVEDPLILEKVVLKCPEKTPLHIAATLGHVNFATAISEISPDLCLARDRDGRNPLHLAAIKGKGEVLEALIRTDRGSLAAREKADGGGTVLHLCVKYNQLDMLKILLRFIQDSEFLNAKNDEGLTVLHLAVLDLQIEVCSYRHSQPLTALYISFTIETHKSCVFLGFSFGISSHLSLTCLTRFIPIKKIYHFFLHTVSLKEKQIFFIIHIMIE